MTSFFTSRNDPSYYAPTLTNGGDDDEGPSYSDDYSEGSSP